jgi:WD40 repeat protein
MAELPIIVLAFANDQEGRNYLRDLPQELRRLQEILSEAERNGLCKLDLLPNATLDQIFGVFTRNRDKVTILHYAGHAESGRLLLESNLAGGAAANGAGLATFLGQRQGLQLVFLNGCSTRAQAARLLEAGIASVITTSRAIEDTVAREFAAAFYTELASGAPLCAAYEASRGRMLAARGDSPTAYYQTRNLGPAAPLSPEASDDHGFPWEFRPGTELVERWSLPDAAGNPEFGLPHLSEIDLPESPFRHLAWFTARHAEIFFGRGYQIRELYEQIIDPTGPPILLLYGSSGVGKSSLLDAGLVPRLEAGGSEVRYNRRDGQKGLGGSLRDVAGLAGSPLALGKGWRAAEAKLGKPLVIFLDQVEEVFTRPEPARPRELDDFLVILSDALGSRDSRPQGKLVLGFRKEWLAEIDRRLAEANLPRTKVFLKQLDRRGIIEVIRGPSRAGRLQKQYRLAIEDGLPEVIAEDLLADAGSALAPTLQVLLTKMWERAQRANPDQPTFDRALYESLKSEGYLLKDVLDEGLAAIGCWNADVEKSGLALDVLAYHTTDLGTAAQRTRAELDARYAHQAALLDGLLARCKDGYLILEAEPLPDSQARSTRLAHDLLAPLVLQRFRLSIAPGQRARRLLENRAPEWHDGRTGAVLDATDLANVEEGAAGMRAWTADETRLVEESRRAQEREKAEEEERTRRFHEAEERQRQSEAEKQRITEQRLKDQEESNRRLRGRAVALGATLAVTIGVALLAGNEWREAKKETEIADQKTKDAKDAAKAAKLEAIAAEEARGNARKQSLLAEARLKTATSGQLAVRSGSMRNKRLDLSLLLAVEALQVEENREASDSLFNALQERPGIRAFLHTDEGNTYGVAYDHDGRILAAAYNSREYSGGGVVLWDVATRRRITDKPLAVNEGVPISVAFSPDGRTLAAGFIPLGESGGVVLWDVATRKRLTDKPLAVAEGSVGSVAFSPDGRAIAAGYGASGKAGGVVLFDLVARKRLADAPLAVSEGPVGGVDFSPDGKTILAGFSIYNVGGNRGGGVVLWDAGTRNRLVDQPLAVKEGRVSSVAFSRDGNAFAAGYECVAGFPGTCGGVVLWDVATRKRLVDQPLAVNEGDVSSVAFSPNGKTVAAGYESNGAGGVVAWNMADRKRLTDAPLVVGEGTVSGVTFSHDGKTIAAGHIDVDGNGGVVLWDMVARNRLVDGPIGLHEGGVHQVALSPDGKAIAAGYNIGAKSGSGGVVLWDRGVRERRADLPLLVAFSRDGKTLAAGYLSGESRGGVVLWDMATRRRMADLPLAANEGDVLRVAFSPDGKSIAIGRDRRSMSIGGKVAVWDMATRKLVADLPLEVHESHLNDVAFSADGKAIAAGYGFGVGGVVAWDLALRERLVGAPLLVKEGSVTSVAFSPDGKAIAAGYENRGVGGVAMWDLTTRVGAIGESLAAGEVTVRSVAFSPDGKTLAASYIGTHGSGVMRWQIATRKQLVDELFATNDDLVTCVAFGADGKTIVAGYGHGVALWDVDFESWKRIAGQVANRNFTRDEWKKYLPDVPYRRTFEELPDVEPSTKDRQAR